MPSHDLDERAVKLALRLEAHLGDEQPADVVVGACCWILADLVLQVEHVRQTSNDAAVDLILRKLWNCIDGLKQTPDAKVH